MPLSLERVLELLSISEGGHVFPSELRDKRYIVLHGLDPESMRDPPDEDDPFFEKAKEWIGLRIAGEAADFESALRILWESIETLKRRFTSGGESDDVWQRQLAKWLIDGPWGVPEDEIAAMTEFGVGLAKEMFSKSRYEFAVYGDAPYEGESAAILELPPKVLLVGKSKRLFPACRKGNLEKLRELIAKGVDVRVTDLYGDSPLHHAVAQRNREMVEVLLDAGADPNASARFGHAPVFAQRASRGHTLPATAQFDDENHFTIACLLVDRGAHLSSTRPGGETLVDVAANGLPMNERWVKHFMNLGCRRVCFARAGCIAGRWIFCLVHCIFFRLGSGRGFRIECGYLGGLDVIRMKQRIHMGKPLRSRIGSRRGILKPRSSRR